MDSEVSDKSPSFVIQQGYSTESRAKRLSQHNRPLYPGESNLVGIDSYRNGQAFTDFYDQCRQHYPELPTREEFMQRHVTEIGLMDQAADLQYQWCIEAKKVLDQKYGAGNYYLATAERGARNIRYIMSLLNSDARPLWANGRFFLEDSPNNWEEVNQYLASLHLGAEEILRDQRQLVVLDTGFVGRVIKGFAEYSALSLPTAESSRSYTERIMHETDDIDEIIVVGEADYGVRQALKTHNTPISDFTRYRYRLSFLDGPQHIDSIIYGEKRIAAVMDDKVIVTAIEKLRAGKKIMFVTTEVDPNFSDYHALQEYLSYKGFPAVKILRRNINQGQRDLLSKINGFMVASNSDSYYGELIDPNLPFAQRVQLMETGPAFARSVSRDQIRSDGKLEFDYLTAEDQLLRVLYLDKITARVIDSKK